MSGGESKIPFFYGSSFSEQWKLFSFPKADEIKYLNILAFSVAALQLFSVFFCVCNFHFPLICILQFAITQRELNFDRECLNADEIWAWLSLRIANPNEEIICWLISEWGSFSSVVAAVLVLMGIWFCCSSQKWSGVWNGGKWNNVDSLSQLVKPLFSLQQQHWNGKNIWPEWCVQSAREKKTQHEWFMRGLIFNVHDSLGICQAFIITDSGLKRTFKEFL